jgi:hypothetical protein
MTFFDCEIYKPSKDLKLNKENRKAGNGIRGLDYWLSILVHSVILSKSGF